MKKKLLSVLLSVAMVSAVLSGCGNKATEEPATEAKETAAAGTEAAGTEAAGTEAAGSVAASELAYKGDIEFMHYSTAEEANLANGGAASFRYTADAWTAAHPDINMTQNVLANDEYKEKIVTLAAANDLPDVFMLQGMNTKAWADQGLIVDLTDAIANSPYADKYDQSKFYAFTAADKKYALPALSEGSCSVVMYDTEVWKAAGYDSYPETWADIKKANDYFKGEGIYPVAFGNSGKWQINSCFLSTIGDRFTGSDWTYSIIEKDGKAKFTDDAFVNALKFTQDIFASGVFNPDYNAVDNNAACDYYIAGEAASVIGGNWDVSYVQTNAEEDLLARTAFAPLPQPDGATGSTKTHATGMGYGLAINAKVAEDPDKLAACIDLVLEMTGPTFADYLAENYALTGLTAAAAPDLSKFDDFTANFYNYYENPGCEIYDSYINSAVIDVLNTDLQTMINGDTTPEKVAEDTQKAYEAN